MLVPMGTNMTLLKGSLSAVGVCLLITFGMNGIDEAWAEHGTGRVISSAPKASSMTQMQQTGSGQASNDIRVVISVNARRKGYVLYPAPEASCPCALILSPQALAKLSDSRLYAARLILNFHYICSMWRGVRRDA